MLCQLLRCPNHVLHQALGTSSFPAASETFFCLMKLVVTELKSNQQISVDELIQKGIDAGLLQASCKTPPAPECVAARSLIITAFGWTTMLYNTHLGPSPNSDELSLDAQQAVRCSVACKLDEAAQRPLVEILGAVGGALPIQSDGRLSHEAVCLPTSGDSAEDALHVTCLNISTLSKLGGVEICWVKCVGSHLDFDVVHRRLNLFCLPSFCDMTRTKDTLLAL